MRISISGSQCVGKTTLINDLFSKIEINQRFSLRNETTRNVLRDNLGFGTLPINEEGGDLTQRLICSQHLINHAAGETGDVIYDRCELDGLVYTSYLYDVNRVSRETLRIAEAIFENTKYDIMFYIPPEVPLEEDGERSVSPSFRNSICNLFEEYITSYNLQVGYLKGTREERVQRILETIKAYDDYQNKQTKMFNTLDKNLQNAIQTIKTDLHIKE